MTEEIKKKILELKKQGYSIAEIATAVGESANTIKTYCYRHKNKIEQTPAFSSDYCKNCGIILTQTPKKKLKKFCSTRCREVWWNKNRKYFNSNMSVTNCAYCGKSFEKFKNSTQRFCCHQCYIFSRFGEVKSNDSK